MTCTVTLADVISWILTISISILVFILYRIRRIQISTKQQEIARSTALRGFEEDILALFRRRVVKIIDNDHATEPDQRTLRHVLDNIPPWKFIEDTDGRESAGWTWSKFLTFDGERHWLIRQFKKEDGKTESQYLSSEAFQEVLLWFRRVFRAYKANIIHETDLADLWRFILPFSYSGRLQYFRRYFQGEEDIKAMVIIINVILRHCYQYKYRKPIHYFLMYVTDEEREILTRTSDYKELHISLMNYGE